MAETSSQNGSFAAHRYHNAAWDEATNRRVFGACNNPPGHGHNYLLEVTVGGGSSTPA
jgi:6-pyruvoyltetrahydropterin/6-carboxytetrahydropterin synthase